MARDGSDSVLKGCSVISASQPLEGSPALSMTPFERGVGGLSQGKSKVLNGGPGPTMGRKGGRKASTKR